MAPMLSMKARLAALAAVALIGPAVLATLAWCMDLGHQRALDRLRDPGPATSTMLPQFVPWQSPEALIADSNALFVASLGTAAAWALIGAGTAWATARPMLRRLRAVEAAMQRIAAGDLDAPVPPPQRDEIGRLCAALATMRDRLQALVLDVRASSEQITSASAEVAAGSQDLGRRTEHTAGSLQFTALAVERLVQRVQASAQAAADATARAADAAALARRGGAAMGEAVRTMAGLHDGSQRVAEITGLIDDIAFQTNVLALNAAVEAARAGTRGRGFAVVAGEVRALSQRSVDAARQIDGLIVSSVAQIAEGHRLVSDAGTTMAALVDAVAGVSALVTGVSAALHEQAEGLAEVSGSVMQIDEVTRLNAALVEESATTVGALRDQARRLTRLLGPFRGAERPVAGYFSGL